MIILCYFFPQNISDFLNDLLKALIITLIRSPHLNLRDKCPGNKHCTLIEFEAEEKNKAIWRKRGRD